MSLLAGNISTDFYHRYKEDMILAKELGATEMRMSISWTRIFADGDGPVIQEGLNHYMEVIDFSLAIGLEPVLTCYHWDLPQVIT